MPAKILRSIIVLHAFLFWVGTVHGATNQLSEYEAKSGWKLLFDGESTASSDPSARASAA